MCLVRAPGPILGEMPWTGPEWTLMPSEVPFPEAVWQFLYRSFVFLGTLLAPIFFLSETSDRLTHPAASSSSPPRPLKEHRTRP